MARINGVLRAAEFQGLCFSPCIFFAYLFPKQKVSLQGLPTCLIPLWVLITLAIVILFIVNLIPGGRAQATEDVSGKPFRSSELATQD